jgi:hypothetical protein
MERPKKMESKLLAYSTVVTHYERQDEKLIVSQLSGSGSAYIASGYEASRKK